MKYSMCSEEAAKKLGIAARSLCRIAEELGLGHKSGSIWLFNDSDLAKIRKQRPLKVGNPNFSIKPIDSKKTIA